MFNVTVCLYRNISKRGEKFGISKIGSKIKGVFKSNTLEGAMLPSYAMVDAEEDLVSASSQNILSTF